VIAMVGVIAVVVVVRAVVMCGVVVFERHASMLGRLGTG
jgi:hypothetical protein